MMGAQTGSMKDVQLRQLDINEKAFAQLRAADPWQYQQIQAMAGQYGYDEVYDPSDEGQARLIAERHNRMDELDAELTDEESAALADLGLG